MKFHYSSYGKSFNNNLGCGTVVKEDEDKGAEEWKQLINADNLLYNQNSLFAFNKDLSNVYSLQGTFHCCYYLHDIEGIAGSDNTFDNCVNANWSFAGAGASYVKKREDGLVWKWKFPNCTDIHHMFVNSKFAIKKFENGCFPNVTYAPSAFENTHIESFKCDLPSLQVGNATFYLCKYLKDFDSNLGSLICGVDMFTHSKLSNQSIKNILSKIKNMKNWKNDFADGASGNTYPNDHPFAGIQKYHLVKSGNTITYVRVFYHPYMTAWCNKSKISNITDPSGKTGQTLICTRDNFKDCVKWWKKNPKNLQIVGYSGIPVAQIAKITIGYDANDAANTQSAINSLTSRFLNEKGWTVTFIPN